MPAAVCREATPAPQPQQHRSLKATFIWRASASFKSQHIWLNQSNYPPRAQLPNKVLLMGQVSLRGRPPKIEPIESFDGAWQRTASPEALATKSESNKYSWTKISSYFLTIQTGVSWIPMPNVLYLVTMWCILKMQFLYYKLGPCVIIQGRKAFSPLPCSN